MLQCCPYALPCFGCGDATNSYCCPWSPPGHLNQPHHLPGYRGHCPTMRDRFGGTFGRLSRDILEDPCAVAAPCPLLLPPGCGRGVPIPSHAEDRFTITGCLAPRCPETDIYRYGEPMTDSYTGHVPAFFPSNWGSSYGRAVFATKIFLHNGGMYNAKSLSSTSYNRMSPHRSSAGSPPLASDTLRSALAVHCDSRHSRHDSVNNAGSESGDMRVRFRHYKTLYKPT